MYSSNNNQNLYGLRDKVDNSTGLVQTNPLNPQYTTLENTITVDTRDCIGVQSLEDARNWFKFLGGRPEASGTVVTTTGLGISPVVVTFNSVDGIKDGDIVFFEEVRGNTNVNGKHSVSLVTPGPNTAVIDAGPNGNYIGGGKWFRAADSGYPGIKNTDSVIIGNKIIVSLEKELKLLRTITLFHIVIPRDIIPLEYWLPDFVGYATIVNNKQFIVNGAYVATNNYTTTIPQEKNYMLDRMIGFYSSPLDLWRTYVNGAFSMQNQVTPPPLQLWNPPGPGSWPLQPIPYPFQTVPTYRSNNFTIPLKSGFFYIILAGYGVYDLVDWTVIT